MARQQDPSQDSLTREFFARPVLEVAPELLGCYLRHAGVTVRLTEVEAYDGSNDPGSHAFGGLTPRTQVMFGEPGGLYVYFTYGVHWCANLVCAPVGTASAVLLRAGEVVDGLEVARSRRAGASDRDLARGPARLAMTLALGRDQNGMDTTAPNSALQLRAATTDDSRAAADVASVGANPSTRDVAPASANASTGDVVVRQGPRVGVSGLGGDAAAFPWRFWLEGEATVSTYRAGKVRPPKPAGRPRQP